MKKNVASQFIGVQMITASDGSDFTGTVTCTIAKDGAALGAKAGTGPTHQATGYHEYAPTQGETNADHIAFHFTGTGAISTTVQVYTGFPQTVDNDVLAAGLTGFAAIDTVVDTINTNVGTAGAGLTNINLPDQTMDITGNLSGSVGSVTGAVGSVTGAVGSVTGHTNQTGDTYALANGTAGFVAIDTVVDTLLARIIGTLESGSHNPASTAQLAALTDWINGGRLDLLLDAIKVVTDAQTAITPAALVDLVWDELIVGAHNTNNSAGKTLRLLKEAGGYSGGKIYINPNGTAGTTDYENGTDSNPVTTLADALTLGTSLNIADFHVTRDTTVAPTADFTNKTVFGNGYTMTLGGHDYAGTHIYHASPVTGTATSSGNSDHFDMLECIIGDITVDDAHLTRCILTGTITLSGIGTLTPGELKMINCWSGIPGSSTPILDFGTGSENHNVTIGAYENGLEIRNFNKTTTGGTDLLSISGTGQLIIASTCDGGTINLRGQWKITDNSGGAVTITKDDIAASILDARSEPAQGAPGVSETTETKIDWLYKAFRNKSTQTATTYSLYNDDTTTVDSKATVSDDNTTATKGEIATGP